MITRWLAASLFFVGLVVAWHLVVKAQIWSPLLLPSPASVLEYLRTAAQDGTLWEATVVTVRRLLIGYGLGILVGLPLGLLTASFRWCHDTIGILALGLQTLPVSVGCRWPCCGSGRLRPLCSLSWSWVRSGP